MFFSGGIANNSGSASTVTLTGSVATLDAESAAGVTLSVPNTAIIGYAREGDDLIITLANGERIVLERYFDDSDGEDNPRLEIIDAESGQYVEVNIPEDPAQGSFTPMVADAGVPKLGDMAIVGLGVLGLAAAASIAIAGSETNKDGDNRGDGENGGGTNPVPPHTPSSLFDRTNPDGTVTARGKAVPESKVEITWPDGTTSRGKADKNGDFEFTSPRPQPKGEMIFKATDPSGNASDPVSHRYDADPSDDDTPPPAPRNLIRQINEDGTVTVSGQAEPGSDVVVTWPDESSARATTDPKGVFTVTSETAQSSGKIRAEATDVSDNVSEVAVLFYGTTEQKVSTETGVDQELSDVAALDDGGWVVTWLSRDQDEWHIFQKRYDASGNQVGKETHVNSVTWDEQLDPAITALGDGGWVVMWQSNAQDGAGAGIFQQRFDASGRPVGAETQVNTAWIGHQMAPVGTSLDDGGWVVSWYSQFQQGTDDLLVHQQRFDANGDRVGSETQITVASQGENALPSVTALDDGGWLLTWQSHSQDDSKWDIYQQRFSVAGQPVGQQVRVNTHTDANQDSSAVTALSEGGWVVSWASENQDGSGWGIYQQRFDKGGNFVGAEKRVNTHTEGNQDTPAIAALEDGGWIVTWQSAGQDGSGWGIYQQRYDQDGNPVGTEMQVNTYTDGNQKNASVAALDDGGWAVTWESENQDGPGSNIYQKRYDKDGNRIQDDGAAAEKMAAGGLRALSEAELASLFGDGSDPAHFESMPTYLYTPPAASQPLGDQPPEVIT